VLGLFVICALLAGMLMLAIRNARAERIAQEEVFRG